MIEDVGNVVIIPVDWNISCYTMVGGERHLGHSGSIPSRIPCFAKIPNFLTTERSIGIDL